MAPALSVTLDRFALFIDWGTFAGVRAFPSFWTPRKGGMGYRNSRPLHSDTGRDIDGRRLHPDHAPLGGHGHAQLGSDLPARNH